ncbi:hypothetical protein I3842_07G127900 [Carya illinoinensis]|uniref:Reverse transcriptase domain-containing protein n=1 Tax=Carya illinoinensis TaxID=32201 RepID=A0A922JDD6_CARIL|nr:hypothetical protein I3842_07G127900 [Carya illinoinensis]
MMNGTPMGFFKGERGLRQGDPLSPYLFIVTQEVLSRLIKKSFDEGKIGQFAQAKETPLISHLIFICPQSSDSKLEQAPELFLLG